MRIRFGIRSLLAIMAVFSVVILCCLKYYSVWELRARRHQTLDALNWQGGTVAEQAIQDRLISAVQSSTHASLQKPNVVAASAGANPDFGYYITVDWISNSPTADGMRIAFQDGSSSDVKFLEEDLALNESLAKEMVLFQAAVYRNQFAAPFDRSKIEDVASIALLNGDAVCSNRIPVKHSAEISKQPVDAVEP